MHDSREIRGYGHVPKDRDFTEQEIRHYRHGYYASISFLDAQVGDILDALDESGLTNDTIVVFTSDHGFHIGEHALWGKTSNFELDARVPLIIAAPDHPESHGKSTRALAELIDLYPTLAELTGLADDLPKDLDGTSLKPVLSDPTATVKDAAFTQHQHPFYGSPKNWQAWGYSIRTDRWRYTEWQSIADAAVVARELYDHQNDPKETRNMAAIEEHRDTVDQLARRLTESLATSRNK
jgi:iduronate 2-sulfatase